MDSHFSVRRNTRLRREFLYRKSLEGEEKDAYEKKRKLRDAIALGKDIPTELRGETVDLETLDDVGPENSRPLDDEYSGYRSRDPKILLTTSRSPSSRLQQFLKELKLVFPNSQRMNRGSQVLKEIVEACRENDFTDLVMLHEHRGNPDGIIVSHLPHGPTAYFGLQNVVLRHDIPDRKERGHVSAQYPRLIFQNFNTRIGERTKIILSHLFPVPRDESTRVMTFANNEDYISFRHHTWEGKGPIRNLALREAGPRFEMLVYQIKLGALDTAEAEDEWVLRPYMSTAKRRAVLGGKSGSARMDT